MKHKALSIRQPWAYLLAQGLKDIENRTWSTLYRGPLLIHAGQGMSADEYRDCCRLAARIGIQIPGFSTFDRGGIIGIANLVDCVMAHDSPWFFGPYGFVLADARPLPFYECRGQLGLFEVDIPEEVLHASA